MAATKITKEGYLDKQSKHLKYFRSRWVVLQNGCAFSYTNKKASADDSNATEIIDLKLFKDVKKSKKGNKYQFELISKAERRVFIAKSESDMNDWIKKIKNESNNFMYSKLEAVNKYPKELNKCIDLSVLDLTKTYQNKKTTKNTHKTTKIVEENSENFDANHRKNSLETLENTAQKHAQAEKSVTLDVKMDNLRQEYECKLYEKNEEIKDLNIQISELMNELDYITNLNNEREIIFNRSPQSRQYSICSGLLNEFDDISSIASDVNDVYDVSHEEYNTDDEIIFECENKGINTEISYVNYDMINNQICPMEISNLSIKDRVVSKLIYKNFLIRLFVSG